MLGNMALRMARTEWDAAKKSGLIELAGGAYRKGMEIEPTNESVRQAYADYLQFTQQEEKALDLIKDDENMLWKFYLRTGQFEQAETLLKALRQKNPEDPLLIQGLIAAIQATGKRDEIKPYLERLGELDETQETELFILQKYIDNGFTREAEKRLASFKERYPDDTTALLIEAWTTMGKGQLGEALTLTNRYLETDTNNAGAWRLRGRLYRLMNQPRKAVDDLQRSKNLQDTLEVRMELATVYTQLNQETAAIGELVPSLDDPQTPMRVISMLESLYGRYNRIPDLEKLYASMLDKNPENPYWYQRSGTYYLNQKDFPKALSLLEKAMDMSMTDGQPNASALDLYLEGLTQSEHYDKAIAVGSRYIDGPLGHIAYGHIGEAQAQLNQKQKATESYYKALTKAGTNENILQGVMQSMLTHVGQEAVTAWIEDHLAADSAALPVHVLASRLAQIQGSYNKAIEHRDKCIEIVGRDNPNYLGHAINKVNLLIMAYTKTSDRQYLERAIDLNGQLLEIQPGNASLLNNMAYLLADNNQQLDTALDYARKAHQSDPGNPIYLDTYAYAQGKSGRYEQSKENLLWAMQIYEAAAQPVPWDLYKHLAMAYEGLQEVDQAIEMYQKALDASEQMSEREKEEMQQIIARLKQS
jgi:tetratricopeptide (TPR) repeat protein